MNNLFRVAGIALIVGLAGCGPTVGTLKGKLVKDGAPVAAGGLVGLNFHPLLPDGTPDSRNAYVAGLNPDGTFEFFASGGTLPPGKYRLVIRAAGQDGPPGPAAARPKKSVDRFAGFSTLAESKLTVTVVAGENDLVIDLAKPEG